MGDVVDLARFAPALVCLAPPKPGCHAWGAALDCSVFRPEMLVTIGATLGSIVHLWGDQAVPAQDVDIALSQEELHRLVNLSREGVEKRGWSTLKRRVYAAQPLLLPGAAEPVPGLLYEASMEVCRLLRMKPDRALSAGDWLGVTFENGGADWAGVLGTALP